MSDNLKKKAVHGVIWSGIELFSVQGVSFLLTLVIARFVLPADYGLIAMLAVFISLAQSLVDSGFTQALIQKKRSEEVDFATVFYFNIAVSLLLYLVLFASAPYIARFYKEPQLVAVTRWIGLTIILSGLAIVQRAKLTINLDFKTQAKASLVAVVAGGAAGVYLACSGYGVWALVAQALIRVCVESLLLWIFTRWVPLLRFSIESFHSLFSFGSKLLISGLLHSVYLNLYTLVIGRYYSAGNVGYYNRAYSLAQFPSTNITRMIARAIFPIQCQMQDDDAKIASTFLQYLRMSCYIIFPLMIGLAVVSEPLIELLLTDKWLPAARPLSILSLAYMWYPVMFINNQMLNVKGRSDYYLRAEIIKKIVGVVILVVTLPYGIEVLCWGLVGYNLLDMLIIIYFSNKVITVGYRDQLRSLLPIFALSVVMGVASYLAIWSIPNCGLFTQVVCGVLAGVVSFTALSYLFKFGEMQYLRGLFKGK
ncbi:MAG: lipopolysaccharide biosynthesis protein [Rikenellaceae bacterium]